MCFVIKFIIGVYATIYFKTSITSVNKEKGEILSVVGGLVIHIHPATQSEKRLFCNVF